MKDKIAAAKTLIERLREFHQTVYERKDSLGVNRVTLLPSLDIYESLRAALHRSVAAQSALDQTRHRSAAARRAAREADQAFQSAQWQAKELAEDAIVQIEARPGVEMKYKSGLREILPVDSRR